MATWPSGTKASATTTAADTNSISGARGDINQAITNQNSIIDMFDIPASPTDDYILVYDSASATFKVEANASGLTDISLDTTPTLGGHLQVDDKSIQNTDGSNRGDSFIIGGDWSEPVETSSSQVMGGSWTGSDTMGGSQLRIMGPVTSSYLSDLNTWNDRVHANPQITKIVMTDDFGESGSGAERGKARIRNQYTELVLDTAGYQFGDFAFPKFGDGLNGQFITAKGFTSADASDSHIHTIRGVLTAPQADGSSAALTGSNRFTVNQMSGVETSPFTDSVSDVNTVYGFKLDTSNIHASSVVSNKYSFYSDDVDYELNNAGHIKGKSIGISAPYDLGTVSDTATDFDIDYSNGGLQKVNLTAASGLASTVINAPTNMADGDIMYLIVTCTSGTAGQNGEFTFKTGVNYVTSLATVSAAQGTDQQIFMFVKSGSNFLVTQLGGTMSPR